MSLFKCLMPNVSHHYMARLLNRPPRNIIRIKHDKCRNQMRCNSTATSARPSSTGSGGGGSGKVDMSLTGKLKELSRKYGRAAIAVYLGISLLDFGVAFAAVHSLGTERIGGYEDAFFKMVKDWTGYKKATVNQVQQASEGVVTDTAIQAQQAAAGSGKASLWTEVVIAYGIHKALFIFARVPITVAITPSIVKTLVKRGWKIGPAAVAKKSP